MCASVCEVVLVYVTLSVRSFVFTHVHQCISLLATVWAHMCISKSLQQRAKDREYKVDDAGYERNSYVFSARSSSVVISLLSGRPKQLQSVSCGKELKCRSCGRGVAVGVKVWELRSGSCGGGIAIWGSQCNFCLFSLYFPSK